MTACIGLRGANGISGGSSGSRSYIPASLLRTSGPPTTSKFQSPEWSCRSSDQRSFVSTSRALLYRGPTKFSRLKREVRIDYPPKVRSSIYKLPVFSKLCFVTEGWYKDGENRKVETPVLSFARGTIHTQIESLTQGEAHKLVELLPELLKELEAQEKLRPEQERADLEMDVAMQAHG